MFRQQSKIGQLSLLLSSQTRHYFPYNFFGGKSLNDFNPEKNSQIRHLPQSSCWKFNNIFETTQHYRCSCCVFLASIARSRLFFSRKLTPSILEGSRHLWNGRYGNFLMKETYLMASGTCLTPVSFQAAGFHVPVRMDVFFSTCSKHQNQVTFFFVGVLLLCLFNMALRQLADLVACSTTALTFLQLQRAIAMADVGSQQGNASFLRRFWSRS